MAAYTDNGWQVFLRAEVPCPFGPVPASFDVPPAVGQLGVDQLEAGGDDRSTVVMLGFEADRAAYAEVDIAETNALLAVRRLQEAGLLPRGDWQVGGSVWHDPSGTTVYGHLGTALGDQVVNTALELLCRASPGPRR